MLRGASLNTQNGHFTVIISKRFLFFVGLELQWSLRLICYIFNSLNTEFRSRKKTHFLSNISFLDGFSVSTVISMEMAKNEIFSYCLFFFFWNGNCWLCWDLFINGLSFGYFRIWIWGTWTPVLLFWNAWLVIRSFMWRGYFCSKIYHYQSFLHLEFISTRRKEIESWRPNVSS